MVNEGLQHGGVASPCIINYRSPHLETADKAAVSLVLGTGGPDTSSIIRPCLAAFIHTGGGERQGAGGGERWVQEGVGRGTRHVLCEAAIKHLAAAHNG